MTNKEIVQRFNHACLAGGDAEVFEQIFHPDFVNHTTIPGMGSGIDSMRNAIFNLLHVGLSDIRLEIDDQLGGCPGDWEGGRDQCVRYRPPQGRQVYRALGAEHAAFGRAVPQERISDQRNRRHGTVSVLPQSLL